MSRLLIFLIAGWSGFFVMTIELLSGRILAPFFGSSIYVWGGVITVFMLALATGYLVGGRLSVKNPTVEKLSTILLLAAVVSTPVMLAGDQALDRVFLYVHDPRYGSMLSAALLFFLPTTISGMVPPYAVRLLVSEYRFCGHYAGLLYCVSTLGSAAGTLITSFYLVLYLEINQILWIIVGISTMLVAVTLGLVRIEKSCLVSRLCCCLMKWKRNCSE